MQHQAEIGKKLSKKQGTPWDWTFAIWKLVSRKLPPGKFPLIKLPPGKFPPPRKIPTWNIPTHVFKYSHTSF